MPAVRSRVPEPAPPSKLEAQANRVLFAALRQQRIVEELARTGRVEAALLADELGVSTESIRKDLTALQRRGLLQRVHGGAIARSTPAANTADAAGEPSDDKLTAFAREKAAIAEVAMAYVPTGGSVLLDAGSTTARVAARLPNRALTVATTSLSLALTIAQRAQITVHCLGGLVRPPGMAGVGQVPLDALSKLNVDVAFLSTSALSLERGLTTADEQEAMVKTHMLPVARRRILLADSSKFGRESLWRHAELADLDLVITDARISASDRQALERAGVAVEVAAKS